MAIFLILFKNNPICCWIGEVIWEASEPPFYLRSSMYKQAILCISFIYLRSYSFFENDLDVLLFDVTQAKLYYLCANR